jgi:hypothetical protein
MANSKLITQRCSVAISQVRFTFLSSDTISIEVALHWALGPFIVPKSLPGSVKGHDLIPVQVISRSQLQPKTISHRLFRVIQDSIRATRSTSTSPKSVIFRCGMTGS